MTKILFAGFCLFWFSAQAQLAEPATCLLLEGAVVDLATHQPIPDAQLFAKLPTSRKKLVRTSSTGTFSEQIPCEATAITIEKPGYRSQNLTLESVKKTEGTSVVVRIPLMAVEQQGNDRPYLQTEQTDYVHPTSQSGSDKFDSLTVQRDLFTITDAIHHTPVQAEACFFFTKSGEKRCRKTDAAGQLRFDFNQADIVALEIVASGYQAYAGNLIIESLDGRSLKHEIQLQRELTLLTIQTDSAIRCELQTSDQTITLANFRERSDWFSTYDVLPQHYELVVTHRTGTTQQSIELGNGLNYVYVAKPKPSRSELSSFKNSSAKKISVAKAPPSVLMLPDSIPMIYFEQGSYLLRADSQEILKQVATYLKKHQNFTLQIIGHTDNVGNERLNRNLSEVRATVTANFLLQQGIAERRLTKAGLGSKQPISPNDTESNKALNRRVSLQLIANQ